MQDGQFSMIGATNIIDQNTNPTAVKRADPNKPICKPELLPFIQGAGLTLTKCGDMIGKYINGRPEAPYPDNKNPKRLLINLTLNYPHSPILNDYPALQAVLPEEFRGLTVAQFINAQFEHLKAIAEKHRAEFIKYRIPIQGGWADVRVYAYNEEGYMIGEYRGFSATSILSTTTGPARMVKKEGAVADTGNVVGTITATGLPADKTKTSIDVSEKPKIEATQAKEGTV